MFNASLSYVTSTVLCRSVVCCGSWKQILSIYFWSKQSAFSVKVIDSAALSQLDAQRWTLTFLQNRKPIRWWTYFVTDHIIHEVVFQSSNKIPATDDSTPGVQSRCW